MMFRTKMKAVSAYSPSDNNMTAHFLPRSKKEASGQNLRGS